MTLKRAIRTLIRPWTDGGATFQEWCLACEVIDDAVRRDEQRLKAAMAAPSSPSIPAEQEKR